MTFRDILKRELELLPGPEYQKKLAPENRPLKTNSNKNITAAVSLIIQEIEGKYRFLLTKRPQYNGPHSGQVSFPGGKTEEVDQSLVETAIRETHEEIGLSLSYYDLIGPLTTLQIPVSNFHVYPFVFLYESDVQFKTDPDEVDYLIFCSFKDLVDPNTVKQKKLKVRDVVIDTPYFSLNDEIVWGATAMMLAEFREILRRVDKKNPGLF